MCCSFYTISSQSEGRMSYPGSVNPSVSGDGRLHKINLQKIVDFSRKVLAGSPFHADSSRPESMTSYSCSSSPLLSVDGRLRGAKPQKIRNSPMYLSCVAIDGRLHGIQR